MLRGGGIGENRGGGLCGGMGKDNDAGISGAEEDHDWKPDLNRLPPGARAIEHTSNLSECLEEINNEWQEQPPILELEEGGTCGCGAAAGLQRAREEINEVQGWLDQDAKHV